MEQHEATDRRDTESNLEDGFFFIDLPDDGTPPSKKEEAAAAEPAERKPPPDHILSHNERIEAKNACFEPIYVDGKPTGEFRCSRRPRAWDDFKWRWSKNLPWEAAVSTREEAMEWILKAKRYP